MSISAANELLALVLDVEGEAVEVFLDEALEALENPEWGSTVPPGSVAVGFAPPEREALRALIKDDDDSHERLESASRRLRSALAA